MDPYLLNALASVMLLGWFTFKPPLADGFGLTTEAVDQLARLLERLDVALSPYRRE